MVLLQTGKRLAAAAFRRESISLSDDIFSTNKFTIYENSNNRRTQSPPKTESDTISHLLCHIKLLLRRKAAAVAALDASLSAEAIRHFSKILDGRRGAPQGFLAECYVNRASAYRCAGRIAEAIADCNRALALDPSCIEALTVRATLFESIRCLPDSLHDLEHLKLLYNSILRDRKLPGPIWKPQNFHYREIPGRLCSLASKIQQQKERVAAGETGNVDYYALIGLKRGCSRSELERAHLLLTLKHKPDKSSSFIDKCEFADEKDMDNVRDRAKLSAMLLYRLIQKGYNSVMSVVLEEEAAEKQRKNVAAALQETVAQVEAQQQAHAQRESARIELAQVSESVKDRKVFQGIESSKAPATSPPSSVYQGVFCRDLAVVGNLLSQTGFNRPMTMKYEALSC